TFIWLERITCPLAAFKVKWNLSPLYLSSNIIRCLLITEYLSVQYREKQVVLKIGEGFYDNFIIYLNRSIPGIFGLPSLATAAISVSFTFVAFSMALFKVRIK